MVDASTDGGPGELAADGEPDDCMCDWPEGCAGLGTLYCSGCGGDLCVCVCGGGLECDGCEDCEDSTEPD